MPSTPGRTAGLAVLLVALTACSATAEPGLAPPQPPIEPPSAESQAGDAALAAYNRFSALADQARADPGSRDWSTELTTVARGQALQGLVADIENYADLPAHAEGAITRTPTIDTATPERATVVDCVDVSKYLIVGDKSRTIFSDTANQVPRIRNKPEVAPDSNGQWLVEQTRPAPDEPC